MSAKNDGFLWTKLTPQNTNKTIIFERNLEIMDSEVTAQKSVWQIEFKQKLNSLVLFLLFFANTAKFPTTNTSATSCLASITNEAESIRNTWKSTEFRLIVRNTQTRTRFFHFIEVLRNYVTIIRP